MNKLGFDLILLGDPTSGKDTQADILMEKYALKPVESGKHWRVMAKKNNFEGRWLRRTMSLGNPTPVPLMKKFLLEQTRNIPKNKNLIFVGNPKLQPEAVLLKKILQEKNRNFFVIFISLPKKEIFKRWELRIFKQKRPDDSTAQYLSKRMDWQSKQSKAIKYFQSLHKFKFINGNQTIAKVHKDILKAIRDFKTQYHPHPRPLSHRGRGES